MIGRNAAVICNATRRKMMIHVLIPACDRAFECAKPVFKKRSPKRVDRKSTRLNSSHVKISYAVFCLKKKKKKKTHQKHWKKAKRATTKTGQSHKTSTTT